MASKVVVAKERDLEALISMALLLWKDHTYNELKEMFEELLTSKNDMVFCSKSDEETTGFIHLSLRHDYVEGSDSSPVGYIEGLYVKEDYRKTGIGFQLCKAGEGWTTSRGCRQIASDCVQGNDISYHFHLKAGFKEANTIICFIKDL